MSFCCSEIYRHGGPGSEAVPRGRNAQPEASSSPARFGTEACGIAFGTGGSLVVLYTSGSVAMLLMRPHESSPSSLLQPLVPCPLMQLDPDEMVTSGACYAHGSLSQMCEVHTAIAPLRLSLYMKQVQAAGKMHISDALLSVGATPAERAEKQAKAAPQSSTPLTIPRRPLFHPALTAIGTQPFALIPQPTGDLLRVASPSAGTAIFCGVRAMADTNAPAVACSVRAQGLMLPALKTPSPLAPPTSQRLYRGHQQIIVATVLLHDSASLVTVDLGGKVSLWPTHDNGATRLGWFEPRRTMRLQTTFAALQMAGPRLVREGRVPADGEEVALPQRKGKLAGAHRRRRVARVGESHDCFWTLKAGDLFPLAAGNRPRWRVWLVRYGVAQNRSVRTTYLTPMPAVPTADHAAPSVTVIEEYDVKNQQTIESLQQPVKYAHVRALVVDAVLTPGKEHMVIVMRVPAAPEDDNAWPYWRFQPLSLATWQPALPFLDVLDASQGVAAPVFCLRCAFLTPNLLRALSLTARLHSWSFACRPQVRAVGSDYLIVSLGDGFVGIYSLTTAQLVSELPLPLGWQARPCRIVRLAWLTLTDHHGIGSRRTADGTEASYKLVGDSFLAVCVAEPVSFVRVIKVCILVHTVLTRMCVTGDSKTRWLCSWTTPSPSKRLLACCMPRRRLRAPLPPKQQSAPWQPP